MLHWDGDSHRSDYLKYVSLTCDKTTIKQLFHQRWLPIIVPCFIRIAEFISLLALCWSTQHTDNGRGQIFTLSWFSTHHLIDTHFLTTKSDKCMCLPLYCSCGSSAPKISCVVSLGCGVYPSAPLGNTDIADALKAHRPKLITSRVKELLTMLVSTVCH